MKSVSSLGNKKYIKEVERHLAVFNGQNEKQVSRGKKRVSHLTMTEGGK